MDKRIVLVANLPCSAGTYLFHYIAKALDENAWLTGETNPYSYNSPTMSLGLDDPRPQLW